MSSCKKAATRPTEIGLMRRTALFFALGLLACSGITQPKAQPAPPTAWEGPPGAAEAGPVPPATTSQALHWGDPTPFSFDALIAQAEALARAPYQAPPAPPGDILERIDYDAHGKLKYKTDHALFADGPGRYP